MRAYSQVATAVAPTFDVNSPGMTALIEYLARRKTVIDGTFNLWIGGGGALVGAGGQATSRKRTRRTCSSSGGCMRRACRWWPHGQFCGHHVPP